MGQNARRVDAVDREDAAHGHEPEAEEEHTILSDLHGGDRQKRRQPERQQRNHRDNDKVLARHDQAGVRGRMRQEPGKNPGGEEQRTEEGCRKGRAGPRARKNRGGGHSGITGRSGKTPHPTLPANEEGRLRESDQYHLVVVETTAQTALQQTGVRLTPQRLAIAAVLAQTGKETSAQELYQRVRKEHAYIGRATGLRALDTLVTAGLAQRLRAPGPVSASVSGEALH